MPDLQARGVRIHALRLGSGAPTIVCVHGLVLDNHSSFYLTLAPALAQHRDVVLYDLRGHGLSDQPAGGYTVEDMVADLVALLASLGLDSAPLILVGHSLGGYIALRFALAHPDAVRGLVLIEAHTGLADLGEKMRQCLSLAGEARTQKVEELLRHWVSQHTPADESGSVAPARRNDVVSSIAQLQRMRQRRRNLLGNTAMRLVEHTSFARDIAHAPPIDDASLARIACPVLAIYGAESDLLPDVERLARLVPHSRTKLVPGCAHGVMFHATALVRDAILAWLQDVTA